MKATLKHIFNFILPSRCISCSEILEQSNSICPMCFNKLNFISSSYCECCGIAFEFSINNVVLCGKCIAKQPSYDLARSIFKYDEISKKLVHAFKYNDQTNYSKTFAKLLFNRYKDDLQEIDIVTPVPMHRIKRIFRQYNPAQILAYDLAKLFKAPCKADILVKTKWTKAQTRLSQSARMKNLAGSISCNKKYGILNSNILLVDDVRTTGSTANYCAKILKKAGAKSVKLVTICST